MSRRSFCQFGIRLARAVIDTGTASGVNGCGGTGPGLRSTRRVAVVQHQPVVPRRRGVDVERRPARRDLPVRLPPLADGQGERERAIVDAGAVLVLGPPPDRHVHRQRQLDGVAVVPGAVQHEVRVRLGVGRHRLAVHLDGGPVAHHVRHAEVQREPASFPPGASRRPSSAGRCIGPVERVVGRLVASVTVGPAVHRGLETVLGAYSEAHSPPVGSWPAHSSSA